jgi:hypothetical protein
MALIWGIQTVERLVKQRNLVQKKRGHWSPGVDEFARAVVV